MAGSSPIPTGDRPPTRSWPCSSRDRIGSSTSFPRQDLWLFAITEHLRSRFWSLAGGLGGSAEGDDWFPRFARELAEFARFKGLPLSPSCTFDLKVSQAGQPSTRIDAAAGDARLAGLDLDRPDSGPRRSAGSTWATNRPGWSS